MKLLRWKQCPPTPQNRAFYIQLLTLFLLIPSINTTSFNYTSFGSSPPPKDIKFQGDAYAIANGIQLTSDGFIESVESSTGRALYANPVRLWDRATGKVAGFSTHFSFVLNLPVGYENQSGDGLAFFLAPQDAYMGYASGGGCLGLINCSWPRGPTANPFVAVEFDTYNNEWDPNAGEDSDHVGVDVSSMMSANTSGVLNLISNRTVNARIEYGSIPKTLSVYFQRGSEPDRLLVSYVVDLKDVLPEWVNVGLTASRGAGREMHRIVSWKFDSTEFPSKQEKNVGVVTGLAVSISFLIVVVVVGLILFFWRKKKLGKNKDDISPDDGDDYESGTGPKKYHYRDLVCATDNFNEVRKLGEGGFGSVYRGTLGDSNLDVAVKKISKGSKQGKKEFSSEVKIISQLRHRNLVQLLGWCHQQDELLLVYDFMSNGSLDLHLFGSRTALTWVLRNKIATDLALALLYLHEGWDQCVVHRDIKSSNIMLDSGFTAKLGDFGLARFADHITGLKTTKLAGTTGYIAPECFQTGKSGKESDVYSFGVVALEIACGRRVVVHEEDESKVWLITWVWELYLSGKLLEAADAKLSNDFDEQQMNCLLVVGLWCVTHDYNQRPSMKEAIRVLNMEAPLPDLTLKMSSPTDYMPSMQNNGFSHIYSCQTSSNNQNTSSSHSTAFTKNSASASVLEKKISVLSA